MSWKIPFFSGPDQPQIPMQSWYPSSVIPPSSQNPSLSNNLSFTDDKSSSIISVLNDKSVDELKKLLTNKDAYYAFVNSLDEIQQQNPMYEEARIETLELARSNLEKEPSIVELKNQCNIIRTSELASAQEKLAELQKHTDGIVNSQSYPIILNKLHKEVQKANVESELTEEKLRNDEIDVQSFVQTYKKLRILHHKRSLLHMAARTSIY